MEVENVQVLVSLWPREKLAENYGDLRNEGYSERVFNLVDDCRRRRAAVAASSAVSANPAARL